MNRILRLALALAAVALPAQGHHSLAGIYDTGRQVMVEGTVVQFHFVNPHPYVTVDVTETGKPSRQWRLEMDNRYELAQIGITGETFKKGDRVIATGSPARADSPGLYIRRLDRPEDGLRYEQVGSSPRMTTRSR